MSQNTTKEMIALPSNPRISISDWRQFQEACKKHGTTEEKWLEEILHDLFSTI